MNISLVSEREAVYHTHLTFCGHYPSTKNLRAEHDEVSLGQFTTIDTQKVMFFKFILNISHLMKFNHSHYRALPQ